MCAGQRTEALRCAPVRRADLARSDQPGLLLGEVVFGRVSSGPQAAQEADGPPAPPEFTAAEAFGAGVQSINPRLEAMTVSTMPMRRSMSWERRPILRT